MKIKEKAQTAKLKGYRQNEGVLKGAGLKIGIVISKFNALITERLLDGCLKRLRSCGVDNKAIAIYRVPGAFEIPLVSYKLAKSRRFDSVICLGCIIRGETPHDRYIAAEVTRRIGGISLATGVPLAFGILTPLNIKQALARSTAGNNKGSEAAEAAISMANLLKLMP